MEQPGVYACAKSIDEAAKAKGLEDSEVSSEGYRIGLISLVSF